MIYVELLFCYQKSFRLDIRWIHESTKSGRENEEGDDNEEETIYESGQNLHPVITNQQKIAQ